jgi:Xaa-Pro aminopeptidase
MPIPTGEGGTILYNEVYPKYAGRSFGRQMCDWQERIDMNRMRRERAKRLRDCMKEAGVAGMLLLDPRHMKYAVGLNLRGFTTGLAYVLFPLEGEPIVYGHGTPAIQDRRDLAWLKPENVRYSIPAAVGAMALGLYTDPAAREYQLKKMGAQVKSGLAELKLGKEVLALDIGDAGVLSILERLGVKTSVRPEILVKSLEIKTQDEIECVRMVAAICDMGHYEVARYARPGLTESELGGYGLYMAAKLGAEPGGIVGPMGGQYTWPLFRSATDRQFRPGDIILIEFFITWNGYGSCYYRTHSIMTKPSQAARDAYKRISDWLYSALSECKAGKTTADMLKHFPDEKKIWGLDPDYTWGDNLMHGIGLTMYGPPHATRAWAFEHPYELKEGHTFAIETQDGVGDGQGVRLEEMIVVTKTGYEVLSRYPAEEIDVCPVT